MKILVGYHGKGNFGDDIILKEYMSKHGNEKYTLFSYSKIPSYGSIIKVIVWKRKRLMNFFQFIKALWNVDEVIWVGGTCFSEQDGIGGFNYMIVALLSRRKISYDYIGINPINTLKSRIKSKILLRNAHRIIVRDVDSLKNFCSIVKDDKFFKKCTVASDLGKSYLAKSKRLSDNKTDNLVISWRDLSNYPIFTSMDYNCLIDLVVGISKKFDKIVVIDADDSVDSEISSRICNDIANFVDNVVYCKNISLNKKIEILRDSKAIITCRLHIAIAGSIFSVPTFAYRYSPKIDYQKHDNNYRIFDFSEGYERIFRELK